MGQTPQVSSPDAEMQVPLVDPARTHKAIVDELRAAFEATLQGGVYVLGPRLSQFERTIAAYHAVSHAIGVNSCTDALFLSLKALCIGPGDEVIVPATTFVATASAAAFCGAKPIFVEVEEDTLNLDPAGLQQAITPSTRAIMVVHFHGHPANMEPILKIAHEARVPVIEDCAQAFGAEYEGRKVGGLGTMGCLSFYPTKHLGAIGDGGMVVTNNYDLFATVHSLRNYGETEQYVYDRVGFNTRLDELQAAFLQVKMRFVDSWITQRRSAAQRYSKLLSALPVTVPVEKGYAKHVHWVYTIRLPCEVDRTLIQQRLNGKGIGTHVFYPICVPDQKPFQSTHDSRDFFQVSRRASERMLALPFFESISEQEQDYVARCLSEALES